MSSWPGLSRPSTFSFPCSKDVDARDKPAHDAAVSASSDPGTRGFAFPRLTSRNLFSTTNGPGPAPMPHADLARTIDDAFERRDGIGPATRGDIRRAVEATLDLLDRGEARVAEKGADGAWQVNAWLKE